MDAVSVNVRPSYVPVDVTVTGCVGSSPKFPDPSPSDTDTATVPSPTAALFSHTPGNIVSRQSGLFRISQYAISTPVCEMPRHFDASRSFRANPIDVPCVDKNPAVKIEHTTT